MLDELGLYRKLIHTSAETFTGVEDVYDYIQEVFAGGEDLYSD
jgi:hypothetical protein